MLLMLTTFALLLAPPLPELRTEATNGGSIFHIRNGATQPVTAYFIELVNYPGSFYHLWQDETSAAPIASGGEKHIPNSNMTVGAVPEYVKLQAALFADGTTAGAPEKVQQLLERRRRVLATARELITSLEKSPPATSTDLKQWADTIPLPTRTNRDAQATINNVAARSLILETAAKLEKAPSTEVLATLRAAERALRN